MKIRLVIISIISLILTFVFAELLSLYHFSSVPTLLTSLYLISMFAIIEYLFISITYIIKKIVKKQKIGVKKIIGLFLLFIALLFILSFLIVVDIDWLNWYVYSGPFYINVIIRSVEFLLPAIILIVISIVLMKKGNKR
jgi:hypothetical protein